MGCKARMWCNTHCPFLGRFSDFLWEEISIVDICYGRQAQFQFLYLNSARFDTLNLLEAARACLSAAAAAAASYSSVCFRSSLLCSGSYKYPRIAADFQSLPLYQLENCLLSWSHSGFTWSHSIEERLQFTFWDVRPPFSLLDGLKMCN